MRPELKLRVVTVLRTLITENARYPIAKTTAERDTSRAAADAWRIEKAWILREYEQLMDTGISWWDDREYEWFINRMLDHLGAP